MARGWESKSVEDQMDAAQAEWEAHVKRQAPRQEREHTERRQSLLLSRSQVLSRLKVVQNGRYRAQLQLALEHLDAQLNECE